MQSSASKELYISHQSLSLSLERSPTQYNKLLLTVFMYNKCTKHFKRIQTLASPLLVVLKTKNDDQ